MARLRVRFECDNSRVAVAIQKGSAKDAQSLSEILAAAQLEHHIYITHTVLG